MTETSIERFSGQQVKHLREIIETKFDKDDLKVILREELEIDLSSVVDEGAPLERIAFNLIEKMEKQGTLSKLVDAFIKRRSDLKSKLEDILSNRDHEEHPTTAWADLHRFSEQFRERRCWLDYLNAYKELHELLHDLSGIVQQLIDEARVRETDGTLLPESTTAELLRRVKETRQWAAKTEFPAAPPISVWIPRFEKAVNDFLGNDAIKHSQGLANIISLPGQQLNYLNSQLVACARRLEVDGLIELLDSLPITELGLTSAVASFRDPCVRLQGLIRDHDLCQQIDTELRLATGQSSYSPVSFPGWVDVQGWIIELGQHRPSDLRVTRTRQAGEAFQNAPSAETFQNLVEKFDDLFSKTDEALLKVTGQLVLAADKLSDEIEERNR